jgi:hypothetical protein
MDFNEHLYIETEHGFWPNLAALTSGKVKFIDDLLAQSDDVSWTTDVLEVEKEKTKQKEFETKQKEIEERMMPEITKQKEIEERMMPEITKQKEIEERMMPEITKQKQLDLDILKMQIELAKVQSRN